MREDKVKLQHQVLLKEEEADQAKPGFVRGRDHSSVDTSWPGWQSTMPKQFQGRTSSEEQWLKGSAATKLQMPEGRTPSKVGSFKRGAPSLVA